MIKKIVIFGATGMTGLCAVEAAVKKGFQVRAFVRDPAKVPEHLKDKVEVLKGNVLDPDNVLDAVEGIDAVVIVLGTRNVLEPTTELSDLGVPPMYSDVNDDHIRMYEALKDSGLNYIGVNAPHIFDEPSREFVVTINPEQGPGYTISKWDLGTFLVDALDEPKYYKCIIGIANPPTIESWIQFGINPEVYKN